MDYLEVYNGINEEAKKERASKRKRTVSSARNGVYTATAKRYILLVSQFVEDDKMDLEELKQLIATIESKRK